VDDDAEAKRVLLAELRERIEQSTDQPRAYRLTRLLALIERLPLEGFADKMEEVLVEAWLQQSPERTLTPRENAERMENIEALRRQAGIPDDA
jgi:hypothetical protein